MKVILSNCNLEFRVAPKVQEYSKEMSKAFSNTGEEISAGQASFITNYLPAREYSVTGSFSNSADRASLVWYTDEQGTVQEAINIPKIAGSYVVEDYKVTPPSGAKYARFAATYAENSAYPKDLKLVFV